MTHDIVCCMLGELYHVLGDSLACQVVCSVTTHAQMRSNANAIYQHLEKFDREKKDKHKGISSFSSY